MSAVNARVRNQEASNDPRVGAHLPEGSLRTVHHEADGTWGAVVQRTRTTRLAIVAAADHVVRGDGTVALESSASEAGTSLEIDAWLPVGGTVAVTKLLAYGTSRDHPEETLVGWARGELAAVRDGGFERWPPSSARSSTRFWSTSDVEIDGDGGAPAGRSASTCSSLLQSAGRDGRTSLAAKGLIGRGLRGPLLLGHRDLRRCRSSPTPSPRSRAPCCASAAGCSTRRAPARARDRASAARCSRGARSAARRPRPTTRPAPRSTTSTPTSRTRCASTSPPPATGRSCSTAAPRCWSRRRASGPTSASSPGPRRRASASTRSPGPTSTRRVVDNNAYTNLMARAHLRFAARVVERLRGRRARRLRRAGRSHRARPEEVAAWRRAADLMHIPRDAALGIHPQDDSLPRPSAVGLRGHARRRTTRCCCTSTRS